jgi:hypothetical protein
VGPNSAVFNDVRGGRAIGWPQSTARLPSVALIDPDLALSRLAGLFLLYPESDQPVG